MFGTTPDVVHDVRGRPVRFMWPYGGRSVLLSGSFTGWTDHIPMPPVEGCPTVFQVVCSLAPGYHQYKFVVDGEWRHDDHQPLVNGTFGVVNTVFIPREPERITDSVPHETPNSMELDDVNSPQETIEKASMADIELSRQRISSFLSSHTAYELLPESGKVVALDVNLPVKQAFHVLHEQGIPVAPLWDCDAGRFVGVITAIDFILILRELGNHGSNLTEEELETHTISAWKEGKAQLRRQLDGRSSANPRRLVHSGPNDSLHDVALKIVHSHVSTIPIIHSSPDDGSCLQLLHLASLSGLLKCICRHFKHTPASLPILQQPIAALQIGTWLPKIGESNDKPLAMLRSNASLSAALSLLIQADVSSVPVVDDNDSLVDIYSRSDITALAKDKAYAQIRLEEISIQQALQLAHDVSSPYNGQRCQMGLRTDSLHKVMERLASPGVRRVFIVEAGSKRVEGIISLSDVFRFLLGC